jgi:hypothetical protein
MATFAPSLADSLKGFYKDFLSFLVNQGVEGSGITRTGIKGIKGGKPLSHLFSLYSCLAWGWRVCIHPTTCSGSFQATFLTGRNDREKSPVL